MKKKIKGFTLVECIVAMAIIGIASVMMAQIYSGIAKINRDNAAANRTLNEEMKFCEQQLMKGGDNVSCTLLTNYSTTAVDEKINGAGIAADDQVKLVPNQSFTFKITTKESGDSSKFSALDPSRKRNVGVVVYKIKEDKADSAEYEDQIIRYKFIRPEPSTYD